MKQYLSIIAFIISLFFIKGCTESISYSGKILNYNEDFYHSLNSKKEVEIKSGTNITLKLPGGGGYGDPLERKTKLVLDDVINGIVSKSSAKKYYGVLMVRKRNNYIILDKETKLLRRKLKKYNKTLFQTKKHEK